MKHDVILNELKWDRSTFWFSFPHLFANYLALKLRWPAIKLWSTLVHMILDRLTLFRAFVNNIGFTALFCPKPESIEHGNINCSRNLRWGSICTFICDDEYALEPLNHPGLLCHKTSKWVGPPNPVCRRLSKVWNCS